VLHGERIPDLVTCVEPSTIRVHAPNPVIFLCGGPWDLTSVLPKSLRDAFLRIADKRPFNRHTTLIAEDLNAFFPRGKYTDILTFEADIAQLSDLVLLFSESFGSAAELGAFSMVEEIASRLLVVIDDNNYNKDSFIKYGPIRALENAYGDGAICVLHRSDLKIAAIHDIRGLDSNAFADRLGAAFAARIAATKVSTAFNAALPGHVMKLIVGLIQHYGALTIEEMDVLLYCLNVSLGYDRLASLMLCAEYAGWVDKQKRGLQTYYGSRAEKEAIEFKLKTNMPAIDRARWRADILEFWKMNDQDRFNSIRDLRRAVRS